MPARSRSTPAPETKIDSGPAGRDHRHGEPLLCLLLRAGTSFECAVDSGASAAARPPSVGGLADGNHTVAVRAADAAGDADPSPAFRSLSVDTKTPKRTVKKQHKGSKATLKFSADQRSPKLESELDKASSGLRIAKKYKKLDKGKHKFFVVATDAAGDKEEQGGEGEVRGRLAPSRTFESGVNHKTRGSLPVDAAQARI